MDDDLIILSLNQGKKFKNYQGKMKTNIENQIHGAKSQRSYKKSSKIEGFATDTETETVTNLLEQRDDRGKIINQLNQDDINVFNTLQTQNNNLQNQYNNTQKQVNSRSLVLINRTSPNNSYLNKNISLPPKKSEYNINDLGYGGYVSGKGVFKPYPDQKTFNSVAGKNGCPKDIISNVPVNDFSSSFLQGKNMVENQSCGNEGKNVYVSKLIENPTSSYVGCYNDKSTTTTNSSNATLKNADRAMIYNSSAIGYTTFNKCKKYAQDNEYQYFGLQDLQPNDTAMCVVSNDYDKTISYGDASKQVISVLLWSSNTASGQNNTMQVVGSGQITIYDINIKPIFNSNNAVPGCLNWGTLMIDSVTYGGNCKAPIGNVTKKVETDMKCNWSRSCSIPISNRTFGDPSIGCDKSFDVAYKCGGKPFSKNLSSAEGQTMILDCSDYMKKNCNFIILLQDDGNMCLYKGNDALTKSDLIWSTKTTGKQKGTNPEWVASKGKYGRNYMRVGETLVANEWIGSNNGSIKLLMQKDGNLVLYTSETKSGCSVKNNITAGSKWVNAVYKIDPAGNRNLLGKMAYIDDETNLREYPTSLLSKSNQYQLFNNTDSLGNDLQQIKTTTGNQGCIDTCNTNKDCSGFVYQPKGNICYLKNSGMYPNGKKQFFPNSEIILGVRKPQIDSSVNSSCNKDIVNIDTIQYNNYIKGDPMTIDTKCGSSIVTSEDKTNLKKIQNNTLFVGQEQINQGNKLYNEHNNNNNIILTNSNKLNQNIDMYKEIALFGNGNGNDKEGMENIDKNNKKNNMNDINSINSMLSDTDIKLLQENYSYIYWSILAIGLLTVTINQIKK